MDLIIAFIITLIVLFIVLALKVRSVPIPIEPYEPTLASRAKGHNRKLRQEAERLQDEVFITKYKNSKGYHKEPPPWFIGTWGINEPSHAEQLIINELEKYNIKWYREVSFRNLILPSNGFPRFDFYLPKYKIVIEYQGQGYHHTPDRIASDMLKAKYCSDNNVTLLLYGVTQYRDMENTIHSLMSTIGINKK